MRSHKSLLMGLLCVLVVSGCASGKQAAVAPVVKIVPPADLIKDCSHAPKPSDRTNGGLAQGVAAERNALDVCNKQLGALRTWSTTTKIQ